MKDKYPSTLLDLQDKFRDALDGKVEIEAEGLSNLAFQLVEIIRLNWGGQMIYIPKGLAHAITKRDRQMFKEFNGQNYYALAKKYNLSERQIRTRIQIIQQSKLK